MSAFKTRYMMRSNYPIASFKVIYTCSHFNDLTCCFVAENYRNTIPAIPFHQIASTNTAGMDFYEAFSFIYLGDWSFF
jgi:hypothetical protein